MAFKVAACLFVLVCVLAYGALGLYALLFKPDQWGWILALSWMTLLVLDFTSVKT